MRQVVTIEDIKKSKVAVLNPHLSLQKTAAPIHKGDSAKEWLKWNLWYWCEERGYNVTPEYKFDVDRKFRADYAIKEIKVLIEYEGVMSEKNGHTSINGYSQNCEKYNLAVVNGFKLLRYTALNYKNVLNDINKLIESQKQLSLI